MFFCSLFKLLLLISVSTGLYIVQPAEKCGSFCHPPHSCHVRVNKSSGWFCGPSEITFDEMQFHDSLEAYVKKRVMEYIHLNPDLSVCELQNSSKVSIPNSTAIFPPPAILYLLPKNDGMLDFGLSVGNLATSSFSFILNFVLIILVFKPWIGRCWTNYRTKRRAQKIAKAEKKAADAAMELKRRQEKIRGIPCNNDDTRSMSTTVTASDQISNV